jgi:hypothetical protein
MGIAYGVVIVLYALIWIGAASLVAAAPFYLGFRAWRAVSARLGSRRASPGRRLDVERELREQYAAGHLTLAGLEARLDETFRAGSRLEVGNALRDLPRRPPRLPRVAVFEAAAGVVVLLVSQAALARAAGAGLVLGAVAPPLRWRPLLAAFAAGVVLVVAPLAAVPLGASAAWRFVIRE